MVKYLLSKLLVAALAISGTGRFGYVSAARSGDPDNAPERVDSHAARDDHPRDHHPNRDDQLEHPPERHSPPSHVGRHGRRRNGRRRSNEHRKGDGSKPSHAYDYIYDELDEIREELIDTEDTFGHDADETHEILAKMRVLEQIQRNAEMLDQGMPQEEFDVLVTQLTRVSELRLWEHVNGPGSLRKRQEREALGHPDPDDPDTEGYGDQHDEEYEEGKRERSQEQMELSEAIRETEEAWRYIPKPMTHDATKAQRKEMIDLWKSLKTIHNKEDRLAVRHKLEHLQAVVHDRRRYKDMDEEDREAIKALREEHLLATDEEEKREISEEIEDIYRDHRKKVRQSQPHGPPEHSRPRKNYHDTDEELQALHHELHNEDDKQGRMDIRAKIRERLAYLRANDPDLTDQQKAAFQSGGNHGGRRRKKETRPYKDAPEDHLAP